MADRDRPITERSIGLGDPPGPLPALPRLSAVFTDRPPRMTAEENSVPWEDHDFPAYTTGRAAAMLGVTPAYLRSLGTAGIIEPQRSLGGHRRYSRHQLLLAARVRQLLDEGLPLTAAGRIVLLEDRLAAAYRHILELGGQPPPEGPHRLPPASA